MGDEHSRVWLVVGIEPSDDWPLVSEDGTFNGEPTAWTAYWDEEEAKEKVAELSDGDYATEWTAIPRRVE